jgi:hypothetical protein
MDGQRARLVTRTLDRVPTIGRVGTDESRPVSGLLTPTWAGILGFGWPLAIVAGMALEPAPADPEAATPVLAVLASMALFAALVATVVAAGSRHPSAAIGGVVTGLLSLGFVVTCPVSGHHTFGAWWFGEMALTLAMIGVSLAALGRRAREPA